VAARLSRCASRLWRSIVIKQKSACLRAEGSYSSRWFWAETEAAVEYSAGVQQRPAQQCQTITEMAGVDAAKCRLSSLSPYRGVR